jgi:DNA repair exonuclease SbcCD ATPase subunit
VDSLSFKEFIQMKVFEQVDKYQEEIERVRGDVTVLTDECLKYQSALERSQREVESLRKLGKEIESDHQRQLSSMQRRIKDVESEFRQKEGEYQHI